MRWQDDQCRVQDSGADNEKYSFLYALCWILDTGEELRYLQLIVRSHFPMFKSSLLPLDDGLPSFCRRFNLYLEAYLQRVATEYSALQSALHKSGMPITATLAKS
jgi:hypothetical protein